MEITGKNLIGFQLSAQSGNTFLASDPALNTTIDISFSEASQQEVATAIELAENAFKVYSKKSGVEKATFLEAIAEEIIALGDTLIIRCQRETGLPEGRLLGERGRTANQLKLFASLLREGSWVDARIDTAIPDRSPIPKADIRHMQIPLGPVGVFGASNFPLAFSVAGGDTASALAAGCPVVVKGHPAHPGTSELVGQAIISAAKKTNMPEGVFSLVQGSSIEVGQAIVKHPFIKAIGFTGSYKGGKALFDEAVKRAEPIPVYAEMGSSNPVFILPNALKERKESLAEGLKNSVVLGTGQFCTNPGLAITLKSTESDDFEKLSINHFKEAASSTMLTDGIRQAFDNGIEALRGKSKVTLLSSGSKSGTGVQGIPQLLKVAATDFLSDNSLEQEVFGPSTLLINANNKEEILQLARQLEGHLTATLQATEEDLIEYLELIQILERKVGRLLINGFPTGVEVCHSMVHGGPFPATTDARMTSVGTGAITRFARPFCYQSFPQSILPDELKNENPLGIMRIVDGERTREGV